MGYEELGLGRHPAPDERDRQYLMGDVLPEIDTKEVTYRYWWPSGWWGDQGSTPQCVAYSWLHFVEDGPVTHAPREPGAGPVVNPATLYRECQQNDEWPGEDYAGTSVRAGAKMLQRRGYISEYRWAWDAYSIAQAILTTGPVVVGTWWYNSMFYPDDDGLILIGGERSGGHAYLLNGVNLESELFRIKNSWGRGWGDNGYAWIKVEDMDSLIKDGGEACLAFETSPA